MVRLGTGVGIVPQLALERSPFWNEVRMVSNAPKLSPYVVGLCSGKRNLKRPAVRAMWQLAAAIPYAPQTRLPKGGVSAPALHV